MNAKRLTKTNRDGVPRNFRGLSNTVDATDHQDVCASGPRNRWDLNRQSVLRSVASNGKRPEQTTVWVVKIGREGGCLCDRRNIDVHDERLPRRGSCGIRATAARIGCDQREGVDQLWAAGEIPRPIGGLISDHREQGGHHRNGNRRPEPLHPSPSWCRNRFS